MTVHLSPHGQQLLEAALDGSVSLSDEERERRRQAVASMLAFRIEHHITPGSGLRIQDLVQEGHKY